MKKSIDIQIFDYNSQLRLDPGLSLSTPASNVRKRSLQHDYYRAVATFTKSKHPMKASQWIEIFQIAERYLGDAEKATSLVLELQTMLHKHPDTMEE